MRRIILCGLAVVSGLAAQTAQFEVASVKPALPENLHRVSINFQPGGRFTATGINAKLLIEQAFDVRDSQVSGGPSWIGSDGYDINAKAAGGDLSTDTRGATEEQRVAALSANRLRLQAFLTERFHLKYHKETREQPVFALVVGKSGPKMKVVPETTGPGDRAFRVTRSSVSGKQVSMDSLAQGLTRPTGRTVMNKTGLKGLFEVNLEWTPDPGQGFGAPPDAPPAANDVPGPSIFSAIQEQLGLKLESEKAAVEQIVIDSIDKPSEN